MAAPPPLLALQRATVGFGGMPLFADLDLAIGRGDKACLIGRNGCGKSTLLRLLAGELAPDQGERFVQPGTRVGWLPQEPDFTGFRTVHDYVAAGLPEEDALALHRVDAAIERLGLAGQRELALLSGGKARRTALARVMVSEPDILLLDEPTNHLDLDAILWLEAELRAFRGGLLVISHDRAFLANLASRLYWLDRGRLRAAERGFSELETWQSEIFAAEDQAAHKLDRKITQELQWLREGISARRTRNMGRVRGLQSLRRERAERIKGGAQVKLAIADAETGGRLVIEAAKIAKTFETSSGTRTLVRDFSTRILRGDRVGVIGRNGAGKTTLLRLLTGRLTPDSGSVRLGTNLEIAYYDQKRESLDPEATLRQTLCPYGGDAITVNGQSRHVVSYLRDFLFDGSQLESPVKSLSGGERNRLLLARLFARPSNLLVLDEPTNDLDMDTLDLLQEVLGEFPGTLLLVSHDRDFLDRLVTSTIVVEGDGSVAEYPGGYSDYLLQRAPPASVQPRPERGGPPTPAAAAASGGAKPRRKLSYQLQRELEALPGRLDSLAAEMRALETELADAGLYAKAPERFAVVSAALQARQTDLAAAEDRWLELEELRQDLERP
ncbi:MAG: ATP-binding cassette domain-containing protein [Azospirillum sp.]|nr:ATP-binding cassette domain-containing protein [Azospirillum sp.]